MKPPLRCLAVPPPPLPPPLHLSPAAFALCPYHGAWVRLLFVQLGGVTDLRLSRRSMARPLLIYTAAVDNYATSRTPGVRHVHPHTGAQNVGVWDATSPHRLPELRREGVRERGTQL